jgi:hypothetical protein
MVWVVVFVGVVGRALLDDQSFGSAALYGLGGAGFFTAVFIIVEIFRSYGGKDE